MTVLAKGETVDTTNPKIVFYNQLQGVLTDIVDGDGTIQYQVFTVNDEVVPIQVFPVTPGDKASIDLTADLIASGTYAATFTAGTGKLDDVKHMIRWFWKQTAAGAEKTADQFFEVVVTVIGVGPRYALEADLRCEGVPTAVSSARLQRAILLSSMMIEKITDRFFEPRASTWRLDGTGKPMLLLENAIIGVEKIVISDEPSDTDPGVDLENIKIYNRHLSQNMPSKDDRENPKLEFIHHDDITSSGGGGHRGGSHQHGLHSAIHGHGWHSGQQNVSVVGVFGYTEFDGTPWGRTPILIEQAAKLMALRDLVLLTDGDCRANARESWRVIEERTRDQTVKYSKPRVFGGAGGSGFTGDPEIDQILSMFLRQPILGAA